MTRDIPMMPILKRVFVVLLLVSVASTGVSATLAVDGAGVAAAAIDRAETAVVSAYDAVLRAEQTGADVSALLVRLNVAGEQLANAHSLLTSGDYPAATRSADLSYDATVNVVAEASALREAAQRGAEQTLWTRTVTSIIAAVSVGFLSYLSWRVFKRRYHKRIVGMKPEVVSTAS